MGKAAIIMGVFLLAAAASCGLFLPDSFSGDYTANADLDGTIFINEVSAENPNDEDWLEIYNANDKPIDLSGYFLSDNPFNLDKWTFPAHTYLGAHARLVIVCDGSGQDGRANFKISAGTEGLYLLIPSGRLIMDSLPVVPNTAEGSYGRNTDGGGTWQLFSTPTKGEPNS